MPEVWLPGSWFPGLETKKKLYMCTIYCINLTDNLYPGRGLFQEAQELTEGFSEYENNVHPEIWTVEILLK